jgi:hypothetical protein
VVFGEHPDHETIWAIAVDGRGTVHVAVCCENTGGGTVFLYAHDTTTGVTRCALDVARAIGEDPDDGHATHGKVHFALCPASDGWVYAATHCTTPPRGDRRWNARRMWGHPRKSFTGGHVFRYRADTGACQDFGIPFPNEGIPLLGLDEKLGLLVGATYPRGHLFILGADGRGFSDLGRASEEYPLALVVDGQGCAWTTDTYGFIIRIRLAERRWEALPERVAAARGAGGLMSAMCDAVLGPDGWIYGVGYSSPALFRFRPTARGPVATQDLGPFTPEIGERVARGLTFGADGKLYACLYDPNDKPGRIDFACFDPARGRGENLGPLTVDGAPRRYWRAVTGPDGLIYAGECGRKPVSMVVIDPARYRESGSPAAAGGDGGTQVSILGVSGQRAPGVAESARVEDRLSDPINHAGRVYAVALAYPPPGVLPVGEARVDALTVTPEGEAWAVTGGAQAHLVRMPKSLRFSDVGAIPGLRGATLASAVDAWGWLWGAGRGEQGRLFRCHTGSHILSNYVHCPAPIHAEAAPVFDGEGVGALALGAAGRALLAVGERSGGAALFELTPEGQARLTCRSAGGEEVQPFVAADGGHFYSVDRQGGLVRLDGRSAPQGLGARVPAQGAMAAGRPTGLIAAREGGLLGSTEEGLLFRWSPGKGMEWVAECPRVMELFALAETPEGTVYGLSGRGGRLTHLTAYHPALRRWRDLGLMQAYGIFPAMAYHLSALACGPEGELVAGEADSFGRIFIFHPSGRMWREDFGSDQS